MSTLRDDLRATAESIAVDAARLVDVEREKIRRPASDPALEPLAEEAEDLARDIKRKTAVERELAERLEQEPRIA